MKKINILGKMLEVSLRGSGDIPLLIMGPSDFFYRNHLIPHQLDEIFTIYFVDIFSGSPKMDYSGFGMENFVEAVAEVQKKLNLDKVALFAHSALGFLAVAYAHKHPDAVLFNILVASRPIWGEIEKSSCVEEKSSWPNCFFKANADDHRKALYLSDQEDLSKKNSVNAEDQFIQGYSARRTLFFQNIPERRLINDMWAGSIMDESLRKQYFSILHHVAITKETFPEAPTFLAMGVGDYSNPFYLWTEEKRAIINLEHVEYYIFEESAHYVMHEQEEKFCEELFRFMEEKKIMLNGHQVIKL